MNIKYPLTINIFTGKLPKLHIFQILTDAPRYHRHSAQNFVPVISSMGWGWGDPHLYGLMACLWYLSPNMQELPKFIFFIKFQETLISQFQNGFLLVKNNPRRELCLLAQRLDPAQRAKYKIVINI